MSNNEAPTSKMLQEVLKIVCPDGMVYTAQRAGEMAFVRNVLESAAAQFAELEAERDALEADVAKGFWILPGRTVDLNRDDWTTIPPSCWPDKEPFSHE